MAARLSRQLTYVLLLVVACLFDNLRAETFKNPALIQTTFDPQSVATADFNGDGILDLVYIDGNYPYALHVLLGNGNGTFSHKSDIQLPKSSGTIINVADVTGDGILDIIVGGETSTAGEIAVFAGNGNGTFQAAQFTDVTHNGSNGGSTSFNSKMAFGDINGDGIVDLVAADAASASIYVFLGNNTGKFSLSTILGPYYFTGQTRTFLFDVNGDGHLDIVVNDLVGAQTFVLLGNGDGSFQAATVYISRALLLADLNGDGHPDLVGMAAPGQVQILEGQANGTFSSPTIIATFPSSDNLAGVGDFNGDGIPDLLLVTPVGVAVMLGQGNLTYANPVASVAGSLTGWYANEFAIGRFGSGPYTDVAMAVDGGLLVLQGNGDGTFSSGSSYDVGTTVGGVSVADFNGDKLPDIAVTVSAPYPRVLLGNGDGTFTLAPDQNQSYSTAAPSQNMVAADFNGDLINDLEILGPSSYTYQYGQPLVLYGTGNAKFASPVSINSGPVLIGDFNNDGRSDMVSFSSAGISVFLGQSNDTFTQVNTAVNYPTLGVAAVGDFNRDGKLDVLTFEAGGLRVWLGKGDGTFTQASLFSPSSQQVFTRSVVVSDLDGDGNLDLIIVQEPNQNGFPFPLLICYGNGDGTFQTAVSQPLTHAYTRLSIADVNRDNRPDLILSDGSGIAVITNQGTRSFGPELHFVAGENITGLSVSDVNGDGFPDIVAANDQGSTVVVLLNEPNGNSVNGAWSNGSLTVSPNPVQYSQPVTLTITMSVPSGPVPTGSVSFGIDGAYIGTASLANGKASIAYKVVLNTGVHTFVAAYNGDSTYTSETFTSQLSVQPPVYSTHTVLTAAPTNVYTSQTVSLTATVSGNGAPAPAGNVTFLDGNQTLGVQQIYSNTLLLLDTNLLTAGTHTLSAVYQGWQDPFNQQAIYQPSTSAQVTVTVKATTTSTLLTPSTTLATAGTIITFTANVSSNSLSPFGGVTFYDGSTALGTSPLRSDGTCTFSTASLSTGTHNIDATFNANSTFAASTSAVSTVTITPASIKLIPTAIAIISAPGVSQPQLTASLTAPTHAIAGGRVTFLDGGSILGEATTDETGSALFQPPMLGAGRHNLFAVFSGGSNFAPSVSPALVKDVPIAGNGFSLAVSESSIDVTSAQTNSLLITVSPSEGFQANIHLSCADGLPNGYECLFSPQSLPSGVSELRIQPSTRSIKGSSLAPVATAGLLSFLMLVVVRSKRTLFIVLASVIVIVCMNGCGNSSSALDQKRITVLSIEATAGSGPTALVESAQVLVKSEMQ